MLRHGGLPILPPNIVISSPAGLHRVTGGRSKEFPVTGAGLTKSVGFQPPVTDTDPKATVNTTNHQVLPVIPFSLKIRSCLRQNFWGFLASLSHQLIIAIIKSLIMTGKQENFN